MKKTFYLLLFVCSSYVLHAQDSMKNNAMMNDKTMDSKMMKGMKDCVYMHDGKMMQMKDGKMMMMEKDMTMSNGTMVMTTGEMKMKDGTTKMMKNNECVDMKGKMSMMKMDKMGMMKDSTKMN